MQTMMLRTLAGLALSALVSTAGAQVASNLSVIDANGREVGRVLGVTFDGLFVPRADIASSFAGHALLGSATLGGLSFNPGLNGAIYFEGADCTGQAWIHVPALGAEATPRLLEATTEVGTDMRIYVGNRTDAPTDIVFFTSWLDFNGPCTNAAGSTNNIVHAQFLGTLDAVAPFRIGPAASLAGGGGAPVAAVTPAALAFLAAVLLLTGIAFLGMRAKR